MAIYRTGQASMDAQGYITGYGTKWREQLTLIRSGATIIFLSNPLQFGVITEVVNDTSMRAITTNGVAVSRVNYVIFLHDSLTVDGLAQDVAETLRYYQGRETEFAHFIEFLETFDFAKLEDLTNQTKDAAAKAKTSETNAKASENAALASKNAAKTSETNAKASETAANNSKNAAKTSETNAKTSETNAASSKTAAANSATAAKASQDAAKVSETNAASSKAAAANSASAAKTSETNAENSKTAAANSASAAKTSETNANNSKNAAKTSETNAKTSETNAKASENKAKEYMETAQGIASPLVQYDWPVITGNDNVYIKIAKLTDPGNNNSHLTLMVTNGGNYGSTYGNIDFIEISARGMTNMTTSNVANFLSIRRLGSPSLDDTNQMRYGLVKGDGFIEVWAFQRAFINGAKVAILAQTGRTELYIPTGFVKQSAMPSGYVESSPRRIYDQGNKPSKGDVGLGNVTNDAQVKKTGDTMSGDLEITKGLASLHLKSTGGNSHVWFKNGDGSERGVIWATPNTESIGEIRVRAKNTAGVSGGEFIFDSAGKMTANGIQVNGKASSRTIEVNNPDTETAATTISVNGSQHTPIIFERPDNDANLSIGFKLKDKNLKRLGVDKDGDLSYGENPDQKQNSKLVTLKMLNADQTIGGAYIFSKAVTFKAGFYGFWEAENVSDQTLDLNSLVIKKSDVGTVRFYQCLSQGGGNKITNKPSGVVGNFIIRLESVRKVSDTDYTCRQLLYSSDTSRQYERYCSNGTWSAWRENVVSGLNQDVSVKTLSATGRLSGGELSVGGAGSLNGNLGVGGGAASKVPGTDKGIVIGRGAMVREGGEGRLILSASGGTDRQVQLRPAGAAASDNGIDVSCTSASGGDTKIAFGQGAAIRCNASGSPIISSKAGQLMYLRPNGDMASQGQVTISGSGNMVVDGVVESKGFTASSGQITINNGGIEVYHATPYIDFHFNRSSADYTLRLIEERAGLLGIKGSVDCSGSVNAVGAVKVANIAPSNPSIGQLITGAPLQSMIYGRGAYGDTAGAVVNFYLEEYVGTNHRAVIYLDGFGRTDAFIFNSGGVIDTPKGAVQTSGSDIRIKTDFEEPAEGARERILKLGVSEFKMIGEDRIRRGFIAQQADTIDECYTFSGSEMDINGESIKILNVDQTAIMADMVTTIQEQDAEIKSLKSEVAELREMVKSLIK
ncbi:tail fiber protein [Klebsiella phage P-K7R]|nr:tail fiber protein [Klebsiella phage P-K7R]